GRARADRDPPGRLVLSRAALDLPLPPQPGGRLPPRGVRGSVVRVDLEALDVEPGARVVIGRGPDADLVRCGVDEGREARARRVDHVVSDRLPRGAVEGAAPPLLSTALRAPD